MGALLSQVREKPALLPPRIVIHSEGGHGKTTMMAHIPGIIAIPAEDGAGTLNFPAFPQPQSFADVMDAIRELYDEEHPYKALGIDTIDHVEPLVWDATCEGKSAGSKQQYESIEDFGYAKGYIYADEKWKQLFHALDALREKRKMTIMVLSHNERKTINDPQLGGIDRIEPKLHKRASALLHEWSDVVGFLTVESVAVEKGDKRKVRTASSTGQRILFLEDRGSFKAKNRYDLPAVIEIPKENPYQPLRDAIADALGLSKKEAA
ncbi:MAG TPA: ATP-binding protein [Candidatus Krumholzibacteria bacterium]